MVPGKVQFYLSNFICSVVNTVFNEVNEPDPEHGAPTSLHLIMPHPLFLYVRPSACVEDLYEKFYSRVYKQNTYGPMDQVSE